MRGIPHVFYDDQLCVDLRYLVAAETWEDPDDDTVFGIGILLDVGNSAQRLSVIFSNETDRDTAFGRMMALHQNWMCRTHAPAEDDE